jgi:hypothetical protein
LPNGMPQNGGLPQVRLIIEAAWNCPLLSMTFSYRISPFSLLILTCCAIYTETKRSN